MPELSDGDLARLEGIARRIRYDSVRALYPAQGGHPGGALSLAEIVTYLYFHEMQLDPAMPDWPERDRFILSKGHGCVALYAALAERGYFPVETLDTFDQVDSILQGHPDRVKTPGVEVSAGTLGQGLSVGVGMALGLRMAGRGARVFVVMGDGELQEGQVWEAAMAAPRYRLDHLTAIVDRNCLQIHGCTEDLMPLEPLANKWREFGWHVIEADGHNFPSLHAAIQEAKSIAGQPSIILARTIKGKGISYMEDRAEWHSKPIRPDEYELALAELGVVA